MTTRKKKKARKAKAQRRKQRDRLNDSNDSNASSGSNSSNAPVQEAAVKSEVPARQMARGRNPCPTDGRRAKSEIKQSAKAPQQSSAGWQIHPNDGQGQYTKYFKTYVPRKVEADFYEFLREAVPIIDAAIQRLTELDGHLIVTGNSGALVDEIREWMENITVNDIQKGILAFDQNHTSEAHEQGFSISEFVTNKKRNDIVGLRVADSKFIQFRRISTGLEISQKGNDDNEYRPLKPDNLMYFSINNENQNPYGTALMRSCEFVSKIIVTIQNTVLNTFERFGDPSYKLIYKTAKKGNTSGTVSTDLTARVTQLQADLTTAINAKRAGKSADFVYALDKDSSIDLSVLGADNKQVLEFKEPMRSALEHIVAKTGLPPWMLGLHWSTSERLSDAEANMLLAAVKTRQAAKTPRYRNLIRILLLLRGRTWKPGDWDLEWAQVNLYDIEKQAKANFLNSQAEMMQPEKNDKSADRQAGLTCTCCGKSSIVPRPSSIAKELSRPTPWPQLDEVEDNYEKELKYDWSVLTEQTFTILNLPVDVLSAVPKPTPREEQLTGLNGSNSLNSSSRSKQDIPTIEEFTFSAEQRAAIMKELETFKGKYDFRDTDSAVRWYYGQSYSLGLIQAANMIGKDQPLLSVIKNREIFDKIIKDGFKKVKDNAEKAMVKKWFPEIEVQALAGANPRHVATRLAKLSKNKDFDWERLARTEMSIAAEKAKLDEWKEWKIKKIEFVPAPDACPQCMGEAGIYEIGNAPIPGADTHPRCRCSLIPVETK